jgi:hypothetical protein
MKLQFLCPTHRQQLSTNPSYAISCWQNGVDTARSFIDEQQWNDALIHIGCAFESAEIIMASGAIPRHQACDIFASSALKLADLFIKVNKQQQAQLVYSLTTARLQQERHKHTDCVELIDLLATEIEEKSQRLMSSIKRQSSANEETVILH